MGDDSYDYIVIGSGSAGGVVAARLSEDPSVSVLLLEAGPDDDDDMIHLPAGFPALFKTKWDWGYQTTPQKQLGGRRADWPRMKALGGCSSMNAMIYIRGNRADYDEWRDAYGATGWGYDDVLPYFKKAEGNTRLRRRVPRHRRSAARRGPPLHPRAEPRVRRVGRVGGLQAQRRLQRRRAGGRRALPGDLQEGSPLVGRGRLHPSRPQAAPNLTVLTEAFVDPHRARGHARDRRDLPPRRRHPHGARQGRDRPVGGRDRQPADADAVRASAPARTCASTASTYASTCPESARTCRTTPSPVRCSTPRTPPTSPSSCRSATCSRRRRPGAAR